MPNITGEEILELEELESITTSRGWAYIRKILGDHRLFCLEKSHSCLKKFDDRMAGEWLARSEEPQVMLSLISERKKELNRKKEGD